MSDELTPRQLDASIMQNFLAEVHTLMDKYEGMMMIPTMLGCLDIAKTSLLEELADINSDDEDEEEDDAGD